MMLKTKVALAAGALALMAISAAPAVAEHGGEPHGKGKEATPGPKAGLPAKAKAYGRYCKGESRKGEKGQKGTDFSHCVTNMAQAANHKSMAPGQVCKGESKKHEKGEKGTEFSRCVHDVVQLRRQERKEAREKRKEERQKEREEKAVV